MFQQRAWDSLSMQEIIKSICNGKKPLSPESMMKQYKKENVNLFFIIHSDIIQKCLELDPKNRPSFSLIQSNLNEN